MDVKENTFSQAKDLLKTIEASCHVFRLDALNKRVQSVKNFIQQNQYLDIGVVGQFKAGKSSFINGYLNKGILPVGTLPVTSVITRIKYGHEEKTTITFQNGTIKTIPIPKIAEFVAESENPENRKNVLIVDVETPSLSSTREIRLVDTPGVGSIWKYNTKTTVGWFPETGGVLFVISAEKPISENELNLLKEIYLYSPEITIVITKVDLFKEEQIKEVELFTKQVIEKTFDRSFPIVKYSIFADTQKFNKEIEKNIFMPLVRNREDTYAKILSHKMGSLVDSCLFYLTISYQASLKKESGKNKLQKMIFDEHLNAHFIRQELLLIIGSYKEKTRDNFYAYLTAFEEPIEKKIKEEYEKVFPGWKGNLYVVTRQFENWLNQSLHDALKEILLEEEKSFEMLTAVQKHLSFYLKSFRERLGANLERVLDVKVKNEEWRIHIGEVSKPDISIGRSFDFHLDMLWFLFPMIIYRKIFRRFFLNRIPAEVEKNLHRLTSDLTEKINKEMDNLMKQALGYMNKELKTIESLLSEDKGDSIDILKRIDDIRNKFQSLNKINKFN